MTRGRDLGDEYRRKTLNYELWREKADHLLEVAGFIKPKIIEMWDGLNAGKIQYLEEHYITIYFMLVSYALENLLKLSL
jgi:hypothetical protein